MAITIDGKEKRIGLALSGGGFRAAAFHLGVFRKLHSMGLLWKLDLLSCVSGGSIAGGFLAANWKSETALDDLEKYLRNKSIAVSSFILGALDPFSTRIEKLAESYDRDLFQGKTLEDLKQGPRIYFNSTNISSGNMFFFVGGGGADMAEMGEHELGVKRVRDFPICRAVAASSAFPPVFPPMRIDQSDYEAPGFEYQTLTDGGIYDNLGVNPLLRIKRNDLSYAIVSDGGKPFDLNERPTELGSGVLAGAIGILMEQVRGLQFQRLKLSEKAENGPKPLWFSIDSRIGEDRPGDAAFAGSIDTGLTKLSVEKMDVLTRHAGSLLEHRLKTYAPEVIPKV